MLNDYRVYVGDNEKVLHIDGGNGYATSWMCLMILNYIHLQTVKILNTLYILYNKKLYSMP